MHFMQTLPLRSKYQPKAYSGLRTRESSNQTRVLQAVRAPAASLFRRYVIIVKTDKQIAKACPLSVGPKT